MEGIAALKMLEDLERVMAELYEWLNEVVSGDREAASAFFRLAMEEREHERLVRHVRKANRQNPAAGQAQIDTEGIARAMAEVAAFRSSGIPTAGDAVRFARAVERDAAESHFRAALKGSNPELGKLLDALGTADRDHTGRLERLAASLEGREGAGGDPR